MNILGISETDNDSGVALIINNRLVYAVNEERFSRIKRHKGFPHKAIEWVLTKAGLKAEDIDIYAIAKADTKTEMHSYISALKERMRIGNKASLKHKLLDNVIWFGRNVPEHLKETLHLNNEIMAWFKRNEIPREKIIRIPHHHAHASCAYYYSGNDTALVVTCDGQGQGVTATISEARNGKITQISKCMLPNSMGNFYGMVTKVCGFKPNRHEGKITGLAGYGKEIVELRKFVNSLIECKDGVIIGHAIYGNYFKTKKLFKKYGRENISYAFQKRLEEVVTEYVSYYWKSRKYLKYIALAGGVFANVRLNQRIKELEDVKGIFIFPHMADGGISVGAAASVAKDMPIVRLKDVYLGPEYSDEEIREVLDELKYVYKKPKNLAKEIAELLADGKVIARFDGRMEFGPRALGNRTIMYHTKDPSVNDWLNKNLRRSEFMPFAPVTLKEQAEKCYVDFSVSEYASEFMTITLDCTEWMKSKSPAVVHVDGTARPQTITRDINPGYYDIVNEYYKITGIPTLVNTSFNIHEEPIVCSPADAIRSFKQGNLDCLAIGKYLVFNSLAQ